VEGSRDTSLFRIAAALVAQGTTGAALISALEEANVRLCTPPLSPADIRRIARSASRYAAQ
jgi:Primase C terminal 1 (PriCT-1)